MKKRILSLLLAATMLLSLLPMTVFATGTSYAITNGTPEIAKETNHGYITIDKATAAEGETVTVTVNPADGYQLKSLTAVPEAPTISTIADVLATVEGFPEDTSGGKTPVAPSGPWINENGVVAFKYSSALILMEDGYTYGQLSTEVKKEENCFTASIAYGTLKFNMTNGILTSFEFTGDPSKPNAAVYVGTYTPESTPSPRLKPITPAKQQDGTYQFTMPDYAVTVKAVFEAVGGTGKTLPYSFDFETDMVAEGWTNIDYDGDDQDWITGTTNYKGNEFGNNGSECAISQSYENYVGAFHADNWLFSPAITIPAGGAIVSWYEQSQDPNYPDYYEVYICETNTEIDLSKMTKIFSGDAANPWTQRSVELIADEYAGKTVYIAFRHLSYDCYFLEIDDFAAEAKSVSHTHNPVKVTGQAATETAAGFKDYYECKDDEDACHKYFEDATANVEITDLDAWKAQGGNGYIAPLVHSITPVNGQDATDTEAGYMPYYECKNCGKYYEDDTGLVEIPDINAWKAEGGAGYLAPLHGTDNDHDHICDYCDKQISECADENKDHKCDYCGETISDHADTNKDHKCDYCGETISDHADTNKDHKCDYCGKQISECADGNKDHLCDICGDVISSHVDRDRDHMCDICGCRLSECMDIGKNHICDICGKRIS